MLGREQADRRDLARRRAAREVVGVAGGVPTEASLLAARCALGESGPAPIRAAGGRSSSARSARSGSSSMPAAIGAAAPLADLVRGADSIETARAAMAADGIRTELDYERERSPVERRRSRGGTGGTAGTPPIDSGDGGATNQSNAVEPAPPDPLLPALVALLAILVVPRWPRGPDGMNRAPDPQHR